MIHTCCVACCLASAAICNVYTCVDHSDVLFYVKHVHTCRWVCCWRASRTHGYNPRLMIPLSLSFISFSLSFMYELHQVCASDASSDS